MQIGDAQINTPYDLDPLNFDPDWRLLCARAMPQGCSTRKLPSAITSDKHIRTMRSLLNREKAPNRGELRLFGTAQEWYNNANISTTKDRLEALLLTGMPLNIIRQDIAGDMLPDDVIHIFERLCFNIRTEDGKLEKSCAIRTRFAIPGVLELQANAPAPILYKAVGHQLGYVALTQLWFWSDAHGLTDVGKLDLMDEIMRATQARVLHRLVANTINNFDLIGVLKHYVEYMRLQHDTGTTDSAKKEGMMTKLKMLELTAPTVFEQAKTVDEKVEIMDFFANKFGGSAAQRVLNQQIEDGGLEKGVEAVTTMVTKTLDEFKEDTTGETNASDFTV